MSDNTRQALPTYYPKLRKKINLLIKGIIGVTLVIMLNMLINARGGIDQTVILVILAGFYVVIALGVRALLHVLVDIADGVTELRLEARKRNPDL